MGESNPQLRLALATIRQAELNLEFTTVRAPADGYVTHLRLRIGSHAVANQPTLALVDTATYWVDAYVKETRIAGIRPGDQAVVTLMTYPDRPLKGVVDSLGWGISQQDGSTAANLLPRGQRDVRVDPAGAADSRASPSCRRAQGCRVAGRLDVLGAHRDTDRRRPTERAPGATTVRRST